jgi:hypothetical protein
MEDVGLETFHDSSTERGTSKPDFHHRPPRPNRAQTRSWRTGIVAEDLVTTNEKRFQQSFTEILTPAKDFTGRSFLLSTLRRKGEAEPVECCESNRFR